MRGIESESASEHSVAFAVVSSGRKLAQAFPGQLMAVGGYFHNSYFSREAKKRFPIDNAEDGIRSVYGIPVDFPKDPSLVIPHRYDAYDDPHLDEVNLYARKGDENVAVPKSMWTAIVVSEANWPTLAAHAEHLPNIPIFNTASNRINLSLVYK